MSREPKIPNLVNPVLNNDLCKDPYGVNIIPKNTNGTLSSVGYILIGKHCVSINTQYNSIQAFVSTQLKSVKLHFCDPDGAVNNCANCANNDLPGR